MKLGSSGYAPRCHSLPVEMNPNGHMQCSRLRPGLEPALSEFLADIARNGEDSLFAPHATDLTTLRTLATNPGQDVYLVFMTNGAVRAYGLLRGWNEGYDVPSLGIAVHPQFRGKGLATRVMDQLESEARNKHAPAIRLRVHKQNQHAIDIYRLRGYEMSQDPVEPHLLVGIKTLGATA